MSSSVTPQHAEELSTGARQLGVELSPQQHEQLLGYLALLIKWNKAYNLTAVRDPNEMVSRHLLDSLSVMSFIEDGRWLDMGTAFDEASPLSATAHFEQLADYRERDLQVRDNRRTLYNAMAAQGFSNLSSEWWHYDYGDQLWAWHTGASAALYGPVQLQTLDTLWRKQLEQQLAAEQH